MSDLDIGKEIAEADARLAISNSKLELPLDITIRSIALTVAQRHCGDTVVKEGNLYQHLKMDNKMSGPLTVGHVMHCALIFEMYLWGKWSKDIAGKAMAQTLNEMDQAIKNGAFEKRVDELSDEPPTRPHGGGEAK